jgi:hypothetical protein
MPTTTRAIDGPFDGGAAQCLDVAHPRKEYSTGVVTAESAVCARISIQAALSGIAWMP